MRKIILLLLIVPFLSNCTQYTAMVGPSITLAETGNYLRATGSLSSSLAMNTVKQSFTNELNSEKICPTFHSSELSQIFFRQLNIWIVSTIL